MKIFPGKLSTPSILSREIMVKKNVFIIVLFYSMFLFSLRQAAHIYRNIFMADVVTTSIEEFYKMKDEAVGVKEDFWEFINFSKNKIPPHSNILFFTPHPYYLENYGDKTGLYTYHPKRARFYIYPVMLWQPEKFILKKWDVLRPEAKMNILSEIEYIIGYSLKEEWFPGFEEIHQFKKGKILKKK